MTPEAAPDDCPGTDIDPFSDAFLADPFPFLEELRSLGDVFFLRKYQVWGVARHSQVTAVLQNPGVFSNAAGVGYSNLKKEEPWRAPSIILEVDPPVHTTTRGILTRVLSPRALRELQVRFAQEAEILADRLVTAGTFDAVTDLAQAFILKVFPDSLGLPPADRENLLTYGGITFNSLGPRNPRFDEAMRRAEEIKTWVSDNCARQALTPGGFGDKIFESADAGLVTEDEAALLVRSLLTAGVDTTVSAIGFAIRRFAEHPDQWELLRKNPSLIRSAFDEVVRIDSPVIGFFRTTTSETTLGTTTIPSERKVMVFFSGANRDPDRWEAPDRFDITRRTPGHTGFGAGIHGCAGQMVSRLETEALLTAFAQRVERWELSGPPTAALNNTLRALASLPVRVHQDAAHRAVPSPM
ncbi:cytochrome P450 [Rhodococcus sp. JVH1]|uniref:cytochrome P450 n=1 Tax=Rhodococcus sp. JVH1 TaxID=745408 RepID=UPI0002720E26|nr:cytochrome P450 [Rhodococcus sp. JVH1]EJI95866.1 cytochrome P450 family protein [Rhodococcus sp. JVH1]